MLAIPYLVVNRGALRGAAFLIALSNERNSSAG
jgi:hypothetical protein